MSKDYNYDAPYKIYFIEYDEAGNEIGRGVFARSYKYSGTAHRKAYEIYGDRKRFKYTVAQRDPWVDYFERCKCDVCNKEYDRPETHYAGDDGYRIEIRRSKYFDGTEYGRFMPYRICKECFDKIYNYIVRISVGTDELEAHNDG